MVYPPLITSKYAGFEEPPPGAGLDTVTVAVPAVATSVALMVAVTCELETNVVVRALPFQFTVAPETKPVPFTVKVNVAEPGAFCEGNSGALMRGSAFVANAAVAPIANISVAITVRPKVLKRCEIVRSRGVVAGRQVFTRCLPLDSCFNFLVFRSWIKSEPKVHRSSGGGGDGNRVEKPSFVSWLGAVKMQEIAYRAFSFNGLKPQFFPFGCFITTRGCRTKSRSQ